MLAILSTHPIQYQTPIWRGLAQSGVSLQVFFMSDQGLKARFDPGFGRDLAWDIDLLDGYPHEFLPVHTGRRQDAFGWLRLRRGFGRMLKDRGVTVLWVQGWQVLAYWQAIVSARRAGIEVWLRGESNLRSNRGGFRQSLKWLVLRRLLDRVDRFLTIGRANAAFYRRLGYPDSRMTPAPYCIENGRFAAQAEALRPQRAALRRRFDIPDDAFCFLSVGKFVAKKRPLDIVAAAALLAREQPQQKLHLLWVGSGELEGALRAACAPEGERTGSDRPAATFAGFLNQSEIAAAYVAADALVLPSDAGETWGLVVNEAMASGLPCIVSDACGSADDLVLPHFPAFCFPVGDVAALARAMQAMIEQPPARERLATIIDDYDVRRTVANAADLYLRRTGGPA